MPKVHVGYPSLGSEVPTFKNLQAQIADASSMPWCVYFVCFCCYTLAALIQMNVDYFEETFCAFVFREFQHCFSGAAKLSRIGQDLLLIHHSSLTASFHWVLRKVHCYFHKLEAFAIFSTHQLFKTDEKTELLCEDRCTITQAERTCLPEADDFPPPDQWV